ncbi:flagellar operon protein [Alkalibacterium subtropicum]|uniref:Flagellar operon protein n=1 Tax=Alkalibacterium subtropicum TaxID=753702 RepID=A0A1I1IW28_9LACT|nr:hypothetical protein [Alkalibacterium subtropicum]SFC40385.1 flagellar operon protein [Alkalibacterium subtropicum]
MVQNIRSSVPSYHTTQVKNKQQPTVDRAFQSFMQEALKTPEKEKLTVNFSNHAQKRLDQYGLSLNDTDIKRIENAVETLDSKGSQQSLILYDDLSLITSLKNKTVITVLKTTEMSEVTNIDSAININEKR